MTTWRIPEYIPQPAERDLFNMIDLRGKDVIELGNKKNERGLYRTFYKHRLVKSYKCFDINGLDGAEVVDMREPCDLGMGDLVTNIGFTEHVGPEWEHQKTCWKNAYDAIRVGGYFMCVTPQPGEWEAHGMWQPYQNFYKLFAASNGLDIKFLDAAPLVPLGRNVIRCLMKLRDKEFNWVDGWQGFFHRTPITEEI